MTKATITTYLNHESKTLGSLLTKLQQLNQWNEWLRACLPHEPTLLLHCQIVGLDKTSLLVIADNPHWVTRFRFFIPELLMQLRQHPPLAEIKAICCKVRPQNYSRAVRKIRRRPPMLSQQNANMLRETATKIKDPKLRKILEKIAEYSE